jgi:hypothetical protein
VALGLLAGLSLLGLLAALFIPRKPPPGASAPGASAPGSSAPGSSAMGEAAA